MTSKVSQRSAMVAVNKVKDISDYSLQFEDVAELRTRTQTVQKALVDFKSEILQPDAVTLSDI